MPIVTADNVTPGALIAHLRWQRNAWALREEMGFPLTTMTDESVVWAGGGVADFEKGMEIARVAADLGRDVIYLGYRTAKAPQPVQVGLAYRDPALITWRPKLELWAADREAPVILVDRIEGERYERGERNVLIRRAGLPAVDLARGRRMAEDRVRRAAKLKSDNLDSGSYHVPHGASVAEHRPPASPVAVCLG